MANQGTVDTLNISVTSSVEQAEASLTKLQKTLETLNTIGAKNSALNKTKDRIDGLVGAVNGIDSGVGTKLFGLQKALSKIAELNGVKVSPTISKNLGKIKEAVDKLDNIDVSKFVEIGKGLKHLDTSGIEIKPGIGTLIKNIGEGMKSLKDADIGEVAPKISELIRALEPMGNLPKSSFNTMMTGLTKLPQVAQSFKNIDLDSFTADVRELAKALDPLTAQFVNIDKVASKFSRSMGNVQKGLSNASGTRGMVSSEGTLYTSLGRMRSWYFGIKNAGQLTISTISKFTGLTNQYIEDINLFTASLGEYAGEAKKYADTVSEVMGIDPGEFMRSQGIFMTLATGFGVVTDRAYIMSKNLTQLGYDISSFFNIPIQDAMKKLESGLAGELEPLELVA